MTITNINNTHATINPSNGYLATGKYLVKPHSDKYGYALVSPPTVSISVNSTPTASAVSSSFAGGKEVRISGSGFVTNEIENNEVRVCGIKAEVKEASETELVVEVPALITKVTHDLYSLG